jgi:FecR-like protein
VLDRIGSVCAPVLLAGILSIGPALADDASPWRVSKSSGEVWMTTSGVQEASLTNEATLKPGDTIRTGRSGRVLLTRGEETMLVSPNSVIALPEHQKDGLSTTIIEQAGSVLIQAEKRNVKHFKVETPYLAAVVKGTQFRVSVNAVGSTVEVIEGRVEVADFKSGQFALVLPGQAAKVAASGGGGLMLSGRGKLSPIEKGTPRQSPFERVRVPKGGLAMPGDTGNGKSVHVLSVLKDRFASIDAGNARNVLRINAPLGEVTLNFVKATDGIAHGAVVTAAERQSAKQAAANRTDLSFGSAAVNANAQDTSNAANNGNAGGNGNGLALGLGNGNAGGNGNALALGNGNGLALGLALGNGNGNAVGIALAKGRAKGKL